jgi:NTP pyrophosphatase (non-canonical NTP hydrolase)
MTDTGTDDLGLRAAAGWAAEQATRVAAHFGLDPDRDRDRFALVQAVKLAEEVGELQAEVLGALRYCRTDKLARFTPASLSGEFADVLVCTLVLAAILDVDLAAAVAAKIDSPRTRDL